MFSLNSNLLGLKDLFYDIIKGVLEFIMEPLKTYFDYLLKPLYMIFLGIAKILDLFELIAKKLAGMDVVYVNGSAVTGDLTLSLLSNATIWKSFTAMLALGSLLLFVTTFIAVIKTQMAAGQISPVKTVMGNFIRTLVNFTIVPILCFAGIYFGNALLKALDAATNQTGANTASGAIFLCASYDANKGRDPASKFYKDYLAANATCDGYNDGNGAFKDSSSNGTCATAIDYAFVQQLKITSNVEINIVFELMFGNPFAGVASNLGQISVLLNAQKPTGTAVKDKGLMGIFDIRYNGELTYTYYNTALVSMYYHLAQFNYFIGYGAGVMLITAYIDLCFGLIKRMYMLVTLFLISPPIMALYPLDGGGAFRAWKQSFVANTISAYSAIVCMNVYLMLMGVFQTVTLFAETPSSNVRAAEVAYVEAAPITPHSMVVEGTLELLQPVLSATQRALANLGIALANEICQTLIIISGAMFFKQMTGEIARLVGAADAMSDGRGMAKRIGDGVKKTVGKVADVGLTVAGAVMTGGAAVAAKGAATAAKGAAAAKKAKQLADLKKTTDKAKSKVHDQIFKPNVNGGKGGDAANDASAKANEQAEQQAEAQQEQQMAEQQAKEEEAVLKQQQDTEEKSKPAAKPDGEKLKKSKAAEVYSKMTDAERKKEFDRRSAAIDKTSGKKAAEIEKEYQDAVRAADAYNPVKNPIQARIKGLGFHLKQKAMGKVSGMLSDQDKQYVSMNMAETAGRKQAMAARVRELQSDVKIAEASGDKTAVAGAKGKLESYMREIQNGLARNDKYWKEEVEFQKRMSDMKNDMNELQGQKRLLESTGQDTSGIKGKISDLENKMTRMMHDLRPDPSKH